VIGRGQDSTLLRQWLGAAALTSLLAIAGQGPLGWPPLLHPSDLLHWWSVHDPVLSAMSLLRAIGLLAGGYWLLLCIAAGAARCTGRVAWLVRLRLPGLGRLVRNVAGVSVIGAAMAGAAGCGVATGGHPAGGHAPRPPLLVPVQAAAPPTTTAPPTTAAPPTATAPRTTAAPPTATPPAADLTAPPPPSASTPAPGLPTRWVVRPGDDLWSISASVLAARLGHEPDEHAVAALWLRVIELNRPNLADPANPDLIFAGEVVAIPE